MSETLETPQEQLDRVWHALVEHNCPSKDDDEAAADAAAGTTSTAAAGGERHWPTYDSVLDEVARADYNETLTCPHDLRILSHKEQGNRSMTKSICPHGVVCQAKLELFPFPGHHAGAPYTGLLTPGTTLEHCVIRLSSAIKPPNLEIKAKWARALLYAAGEKVRNAKLFPTAAIKVFRGNQARSGNLLFGGCKVGQREEDYFQHCQCTSMTERMPRTVKPFVRKFWRYSDNPLSLGVSDFCAFDADGEAVGNVNFPFAVVLSPRYKPFQQQNDAMAGTNADSDGKDSFDLFLDEALAVPKGSLLFDVFACPTPQAAPESSKLERIGRIVTKSRMIPSAPDDKLFFRHQRKEEDFELRPEWKDQLKTKCTLSDGKSTSTGTVSTLAGWELFEGHIARNDFCDFELQK